MTMLPRECTKNLWSSIYLLVDCKPHTNLAWACTFSWESLRSFLNSFVWGWFWTIVPKNIGQTSERYLRRKSYLVHLQTYNLRVQKWALVFFNNFANIVKYLIVFLIFQTSCLQGIPSVALAKHSISISNLFFFLISCFGINLEVLCSYLFS